MDLATLVGLLVGFVLIAISIMAGSTIGEFIDVPSIGITVGGTVAATLIHHPLSQLKKLFPAVKKSLFERREDLQGLINSLVTYAGRARREGLLALESEATEASDPFLRKGLGLVVDGTDPEVVRTILENDLANLEERHRQGAAVFDAMAQYAPAFGLVGTLIGLIQMLSRLDDASAIGPGMAVALLTTFYGALLANLVFLPLAGKLKLRSQQEVLAKELMIEGILAVQAGEGPSIIAEKLNSFLPPGERTDRDRRGGRGGFGGEED